MIPNTATISYTFSGQPYTQQAAAPYVTAARLLSVRTTWQDSTPSASNSPDALRPLTFAVTNLGNATDTVALARDNAVGGDQFDPNDAPQGAIWLDTGAQAGLQTSGPNADIVYVAGSNDPVLAAGASRIVYLASGIPSGFTTGATGRANLQARSILAPPNAALSIPGAVAQYSITVTNSDAVGKVDTDTVQVDDAIPANTYLYYQLATGATNCSAVGVPVSLAQGGTSSTLTLAAADLSYSSDGGATWTATPSWTFVPAATAAGGTVPPGCYASNITTIRANPKGRMAAASSFTLNFNVWLR
ncbi:MAG TPA: hypothetical protein VGF26_25770 [Ramlibacter sp.]